MPSGVKWLLISVYAAATVQLLTSPSTPPALSALLQSVAIDYLGERAELTVISRERELEDGEMEVVFDYMFNETLSGVVESLVEPERYFGMWRRTEESLVDYIEAFSAYLQAFSLQSIYLIADTQPHNLFQSHHLLSRFPSIFPHTSTLPSALSLPDCLWFISRAIKSRGVLAIAFLVDPATAFNCITALDRLKLNRPGYVYFLSQEASEYRYKEGETTALHRNGLLVVAGKEAEARTAALYEQNKIQIRLTTLQNDHSNSPNNRYFLYSVQENRLILAFSTPEPPLNLSILPFPGNSTGLIRLSKPSILASVNYQMTNLDGSTSPLNPMIMRGFQVAFEEINKRSDLIPDYIMRNSSVNFTGIINNLEVTKGRIRSQVGKVGVIHMSPPFSQAVTTTFEAFKALNITVPITGSTLGSELTDKERYPLYVRTRAGFRYVAVMMCQVFTYFHWKNIAVLYQQDKGEFEGSYHIFREIASQYSMNITNEEGKRGTPAYITANNTSDFERSIEAITASDTRVIVILSNAYFSILDIMYDMGIRDGYEIVVTQGMSELFFSDKSYFKRRIVNKGGLMFYPAQFVGPIGETVRQRLLAIDGNNYISNTCLYYDAAMLYFHATNHLLESGQDYEDPLTLIETMRTTRFQGCSGRVTISPDSNDREPGEIQIHNFQYDESTDNYTIQLVGSYNPFLMQPYKRLQVEIQWPNGEKAFGDTKPKYKECGYLLENVRYVRTGEIVGCGIVLGLALLTTFATILTRKLLLKGHWNPAMEVHTITSYDISVYALGIMDFFIFGSLGPSVTRMKELTGFQNSAILVFDRLQEVSGHSYWTRLTISITFSAFWLCLIAVKSTRLSTIRGFHTISSFTTAVSPFFISLAFMPLITALMQVYMCTQGLGSTFTDTIMDADCATHCWSEDHLKFAIPSAILIVLLHFVGVFYRVQLENQHDIQVNPKAVLIKMTTLVMLSSLQVTIRANRPDLHAYFYFAIMAVFTLLISVYEEFNYQRLNMWTWLIYIAVILFAVVAFLQTKVSGKGGLIAMAVLAGVYCILVVFGCLMGRFVPNYRTKILTERGKNFKYLLKFAFSVGNRANAALSQHYSVNQPREGTEQQFSLYI